MATKPTDDDGWGDAAGDGAGKSTDTPPEPSAGSGPVTPAETIADDGWESAGEVPAPPADVPNELPVSPTGAMPLTESGMPNEPDPWDDEPDLAAIVGAPPTKKTPKPPRTPLLTNKQRRNLILGAIGAALVAVYVIASWINSGDLYLVCGDESVTAEKGSFFPWGRSSLGGAKWRPVEIGDECAARSVPDEAELEGVFLDLVLARANDRLSLDPATDLDRAAELLEQAQLLARDPSRGGARADIARLENDVQYWRARTEVETALTALETAQSRLEAAAGKTRHASDAGERSDFLKKLIDIAKAGAFAEPATATETGAPVPSDPIRANPASDLDAGAPASAPIDAGVTPEPKPLPVPAGGVLL